MKSERPQRGTCVYTCSVILPINPSIYNKMSETLLVTEPEFRAIPLAQTAYTRKVQKYLDAYAYDIAKYHPDGEGVGDNPDCLCLICVRHKPDAAEYLIKASELTDTILSNMTVCDQTNLRRVLVGLKHRNCIDVYGRVVSALECACCYSFHNEFLGTLMDGSPEQMALIRDLLHGRPVLDIPYLEDVDQTDTAGILIQILFRGAPEFVEHVRSLIYDDQEKACICEGCSFDDEENDLVEAIQQSM